MTALLPTSVNAISQTLPPHLADGLFGALSFNLSMSARQDSTTRTVIARSLATTIAVHTAVVVVAGAVAAVAAADMDITTLMIRHIMSISGARTVGAMMRGARMDTPQRTQADRHRVEAEYPSGRSRLELSWQLYLVLRLLSSGYVCLRSESRSYNLCLLCSLTRLSFPNAFPLQRNNGADPSRAKTAFSSFFSQKNQSALNNDFDMDEPNFIEISDAKNKYKSPKNLDSSNI